MYANEVTWSKGPMEPQNGSGLQKNQLIKAWNFQPLYQLSRGKNKGWCPTFLKTLEQQDLMCF